MILRHVKRYLHFIFSNPINFIFCIAWGAMLLGYWRGINNRVPVLKYFTDELECLLVVVPLAFSLKYWPKILKAKDVVFVLCCISFYVLNFFTFPENEPYLSARFFNFSMLVLPYFLVGVSLDIKKYLDVFYFISVLSIGVCAFYQLIYAQGTSYSGDVDTSAYNMHLAYNILPHVLMASWIALRDLKVGKILVMALGLFLLLALGTRGPVLCATIFIVVYILLFKPAKHKVMKNVIVISVGLYILRFFNQFMLLMQSLVMQVGLSTRFFDKYLEGELDSSDARVAILSRLFFELKNVNLFQGFGLLGSYNYINTYPHNILVDFVFSFGWVFGILLLIIVFGLAIWALYRGRGEEKVFVLLLICASLVKLFLSGTFIDDALFFMLLGFSINCILGKIK